MLKAVIFDLDGVVADSHPIHESAWKTLLVEQGLSAQIVNLDFLYAGHPRRAILQHYLGHLDEPQIKKLGQRKDELYLREAEKLRPKLGVPKLLNDLQGAGIALALATSAGRARTDDTLLKFGMSRQFSAIITGEDVGNPKPAPDIFLLAARRLCATPAESIVFEDSAAGVQAARAAGMRCVGFAPEQRLQELRNAGADPAISEIPEHGVTYCRQLLETLEYAKSEIVGAGHRLRGKG